MSVMGNLLRERTGQHTCAHGCMACVKNGRAEAEERIVALTTALKEVRRVPRTPRSGWQGMLDRMVEIIMPHSPTKSHMRRRSD